MWEAVMQMDPSGPLGGAQTAWCRSFQEKGTLPGTPVSIEVNSRSRLATVPADYSGLSYESAQLGHPEFARPGPGSRFLPGQVSTSCFAQIWP